MPGYSWTGSAWKKVVRKAIWTGTAWKDIKSSHRWTGSAWETIYSSFISSGMTKNGNMAGQTGSAAYRKIIGWTADTATYPGSSVVADGLVAQSTKAGAAITAVIDAGSAWNNLTARLQISVNDTVVVTGPDSRWTTSGGWDVPLTATATVNISAGDVVTVAMSASPSGNYLTARSGAGTYVRLT
ncbi:hypothetical protein R3Q06_27360 [Rhodococcus erythropolis]|uniref:hypothetical protein n=1 Tax=Rhodococcus erythropolis TaxID=1833 RepID=UPI0029491A2B|nr:hypothetical protein [Rhodococcus erythropolis]MDV6277218.1 hypothetical protein [Rhodococcus erythropolis]